MSNEILRQHQAVWQSKPILRLLYTEWYREIVSWLQPGQTLEVGGGTGNLKEFAPSVVCTDIVKLPWLDAVADAQQLPFVSDSLANIVLFDTLHHLENVRYFFDEALRVLQPGGRVIIMDPYISVCSWPVYHFLHPEPVDFRQDPLALSPMQPGRKPFDANQAISTILFERSSRRFHELYPSLKKLQHHRLAFFAYPLSGGFDHSSLLPVFLVRPVLALERVLRLLNRFLAFRVLVVLEKGK
ncbi:MAG: methyltransferase domain-containing protein [Nitrospirae bacterium]|nr:methyltransferase domain-containing protein [Nitrospirota bacterium]MDE3039481.1 class I SAM-dependent methyltransferase [Nitrospirota bacterium]